MELSAPSMRGSISPLPNTAQRPVRDNIEEFPSQMPDSQGVGMYEYRMLHTITDVDGPMQGLPPSTTAPDFSDSYMNPRQTSKSSPNILSAEYDPFAPFHSDIGTSYASALFSRRSTELSLPPGSPSVSAIASHRSSFSSGPTSETYSHPEAYPPFHSSIKVENHLDWTSGGNATLAITAAQTGNSILTSSSSSYPLALGDTFFQEHGGGGWSKDQTLNVPTPRAALSRTTLNDTFRYQGVERKGSFSNIARTRTPRKMTTREDANYQCKAKGCGKLFSRSYNYKAHMETHDSSRVYPFPCPLPDCSKKFVRKTDLQRHHQSVHMKERNFQCDFCSRYFARKDTLRRHMEDGCSKRFDLTLGYNQYSAVQEETKTIPRPATIPSSYSSTSAMYPSITAQHSSALSATYSSRADFRGNEHVQSQLWSN